jgi:hypothetical protein
MRLEMSSLSAFESLVPVQLRQTAWSCGDEFVFPYPEVLQAVDVANTHEIAILGVEFFRVLENARLATEALSEYELFFSSDWPGFARANNALALDFIERNRKEGNHGYILTSASEREFQQFKQRRF